VAPLAGFGVEVQLKAMSDQGTVLDVDNDALIVVTMEHSALAITPITSFGGHSLRR